MNSAKTQISRRSVSAPTQYLVNNGVLTDKAVFHHGEGRAFADTELMYEVARLVYAYDPNSPKPESRIWYTSKRSSVNHIGRFDVAVSNYVLNTIEKSYRQSVLIEILDSAEVCYVTLRTDKVGGTPKGDGVITSKGTFQSTKSAEEWQVELGGEIIHKTPWFVILKFEE